MRRKRSELRIQAVEFHLAYDHKPLEMILRITLPSLRVQSTEYWQDGSIHKVERGSIDDLLKVLRETKQARSNSNAT